MSISIRTANKRVGITIRTRTGSKVFPENSPQNAVPFGASVIAAGNGGTLLTAPASGKCWIVTSLIVTCDAINGAGCSVLFSGTPSGLAALFQSYAAGACVPIRLVEPSAPFALPVVSAFSFTSVARLGAANFSISGTAYTATVAGAFADASPTQLVAVTQDGDPASELG